MRHFARLVFIWVTVFRFGLDELALSSFRQRWVRALARILTRVLAGGPEVEAVAARGQADAPARFSLGRMIDRYEALFGEFVGR